MTDLRTFHRHSEKTQAAIEKANDTLAPLCRPDSPDPAQVSVDDLRQYAGARRRIVGAGR